MGERILTALAFVALAACSSSNGLSTDTSCAEILDTHDLDTDAGLEAFSSDLAGLNGGEITLDRPTFAAGYCQANPGWTLGLALSQDTNPFTDEQLAEDPLSADPLGTISDTGASSTVEIAEDDTGTARFTVSVDDPSSAQIAAEALDIALAEYDSTPATVNGSAITVEVRDITYAEAKDIRLESVGQISLRPVVGPEQVDSPGSEVLATVDGSAEVVGPAQADGSVFGPATVSADGVGGWSITVEIRGPQTWEFLAEQCISRAPTCPGGQIAIVADGEILIALTVVSPSAPDPLMISGVFDETEARDIANTINRSLAPLLQVTELRFVPDE